MPYLRKAQVEHIRLEAKIEALNLAAARITSGAGPVNCEPRTAALWLLQQAENLQHMLEILERRARL